MTVDVLVGSDVDSVDCSVSGCCEIGGWCSSDDSSAVVSY